MIGSRPDRFDMVGLAVSGGNIDLLAGQVAWFRPSHVALARTDRAADLEYELATRGVEVPQLLTGPEATAELAALKCGVMVNTTTGAVELKSTLAALETGLILALANKESLVTGGRLVTNLATPGQLVAVDSEHPAFAQALCGGCRHEVTRLILTAPGRPFRGCSREKLADVTSEEAMAHPTWKTSRVIIIDSSTLINKGLEFIEAALPYGVGLDGTIVTVHPQSAAHSMVEPTGGSTLARAPPPDMRLPIGLALTWPDGLPGAAVLCNWTRFAIWTFEPLDDMAFPTIELTRRVGKTADTALAVYNAANGVLMDAFYDHGTGLLGITDLISRCLTEHLETGYIPDTEPTLEAVLPADAAARERVRELVEELF